MFGYLWWTNKDWTNSSAQISLCAQCECIAVQERLRKIDEVQPYMNVNTQHHSVQGYLHHAWIQSGQPQFMSPSRLFNEGKFKTGTEDKQLSRGRSRWRLSDFTGKAVTRLLIPVATFVPREKIKRLSWLRRFKRLMMKAAPLRDSRIRTCGRWASAVMSSPVCRRPCVC